MWQDNSERLRSGNIRPLSHLQPKSNLERPVTVRGARQLFCRDLSLLSRYSFVFFSPSHFPPYRASVLRLTYFDTRVLRLFFFFFPIFPTRKIGGGYAAFFCFAFCFRLCVVFQLFPGASGGGRVNAEKQAKVARDRAFVLIVCCLRRLY